MFNLDKALRKEMLNQSTRIKCKAKRLGCFPLDSKTRDELMREDEETTREMLSMRKLYQEKSGEIY